MQMVASVTMTFSMCFQWACQEQVETGQYPLEFKCKKVLSNLADEKLQWLFKLYDKDQNGEIIQDELEDVFIKMCRITEKTEIDHIKKHAKIAEEERKKQAQALEKQREKEMKKMKEDMY